MAISIGKSQALYVTFILFILGVLLTPKSSIGALFLFICSIIVGYVWRDESSKIIKWMVIVLDIIASIVIIYSSIK